MATEMDQREYAKPAWDIPSRKRVKNVKIVVLFQDQASQRTIVHAEWRYYRAWVVLTLS